MPTISCPDCEKQVSTAATACPHCGRPMKKQDVIAPKSGEGLFMQSLNLGCLLVLLGIGGCALLLLFNLPK